MGKNAVGARNFRQEIGAAEEFDDRHAGQVGRRQRNPGRSTHPRRDEYRGQRRPTSEETERRRSGRRGRHRQPVPLVTVANRIARLTAERNRIPRSRAGTTRYYEITDHQPATDAGDRETGCG